MTARRFSPFRNDEDSLRIGALTVENGRERITLQGRLEITRDREGLEAARELMEVLSLTMLELAHTDLPERL